jgi:hypothetical protein
MPTPEETIKNWAAPLTQIGKTAVNTQGSPSVSLSNVINKVKWPFIGIFVVAALAIIIIWVHRKLSDTSGESTINTERGVRETSIQRIFNGWQGQNSWKKLINTFGPRQNYLVNLQPLTAMVGGYIGPVKEGFFSPEVYIQTALRAGVRSFVLPISTYTDDNKNEPLWPKSGSPAIVFRDETGAISSKNGTSIKDILRAIQSYGSVNNPQNTEPILLYLVEEKEYIPNKNIEEKLYVKFMTDVAKELDTIQPNRRLTMAGSFGSAVNAQNQSTLLTKLPLNVLENKILIFTDFDIGIYGKENYRTQTPKLSEFINFKLQSANAAGGGQSAGTVVSTATTDQTAKTLRLGDVIGSNFNWADAARSTWHITLQESPHMIPSIENVREALQKGIQAIPLPLFYFTEKEELAKIQALWKMWGGHAFRVKGNNQRFTGPADVVPAKPSDALNARVTPTSEPGQVQL